MKTISHVTAIFAFSTLGMFAGEPNDSWSQYFEHNLLIDTVVCSNGNRIAATSLKPLFLFEDKGDHAEIVLTRTYHGHITGKKPYISADGKQIGIDTVTNFWEEHTFQLFQEASEEVELFPSFGVLDTRRLTFSITDDASVVVVPGSFGIVCWRKFGLEWKEAWAIDYWKDKNHLEWPLANDQVLIPSFNTIIPNGADYVLVTFNCSGDGSTSSPRHSGSRYVAALNLSDGKERWRFDAPEFMNSVSTSLAASVSGEYCLLHVSGDEGAQGYSQRYYHLQNGKLIREWMNFDNWEYVALADKTGWTARVGRQNTEVRRADGSIVWSKDPRQYLLFPKFDDEGKGTFFNGANGTVLYLNEVGKTLWTTPLERISGFDVKRDRLYMAGGNGFLHCFGKDGKTIWSLKVPFEMPTRNKVAKGATADAKKSERILGTRIQAARAPTTSTKVPIGENLLRNGTATLKFSGRKVNVDADVLSNGKMNDVATPWFSISKDEQVDVNPVFVEIEFKSPTDVRSLTVYENENHPEAWPTEGFVQVWDGVLKIWKMAARGFFLVGHINTYSLNLIGVKKMRYVPWVKGNRKLLTCEIEVR